MSACFVPRGTTGTDLGDTADVLVAILLGEAKVLVQAEAHIVAIEAVGGDTEVEEVLLEGGGDGGFARGRETGKPEGEAALLAELVALAAREGRVPGDVAIIPRHGVGVCHGRGGWR